MAYSASPGAGADSPTRMYSPNWWPSRKPKQKKKLKYLAQDLARAENADAQKVIADTLMTYGWSLQKGQTKCTLNSIYDNKPLHIALAPELTPMENAQAYYKRYNKFKRAVGEIQQQQKEADELLEYLQSLEVSLGTASTKGEIAEIKQEVIALGLLPAPRKKQPSQSRSTPPEGAAHSGNLPIHRQEQPAER